MALPSFLSQEERMLPEDMSVDQLVEFGENFADWILGVRNQV